MQPQNINAHQRVKYEPTRMKRGRQCRLFGVDFHSVAEAARYWKISYSWAKEQIDERQTWTAYPRDIYTRVSTEEDGGLNMEWLILIC